MSNRLIIEGNSVYEIDEECETERKKATGEGCGEQKTKHREHNERLPFNLSQSRGRPPPTKINTTRGCAVIHIRQTNNLPSVLR